MKKFFITAAFILALIPALFSPAMAAGMSGQGAGAAYMQAESQELAPLIEEPDKPMSLEAVLFLGRNREVEKEISSNPGMVGRLIIPNRGINVALFTDGPGETEAEKRQNICDTEDAAALFSDDLGTLIADHNNQAFSTLNEVQPGDRAFILRGHSILSLECSNKMDGYNYGQGIVDAEGYFVTSYAEYICYTCKEDWNNVSVIGFAVLDEDYVI